jgi:hypothetical protein
MKLGRPLARALPSIITRVFILVRNLTNPVKLIKTLVVAQILIAISVLVFQKNLTKVRNVGNSFNAQNLIYIKVLIFRTSLTNVKNVAKLLIKAQTLFDIREFILERNPVSVKNVANPLAVIPI